MLNRNLPALFDEPENVTSISGWMDRMFDEMINRSSGSFVPKLNVAETEKTFEVTVALPGMKKDDIDIYFENNSLTVSGERRWENEERNGRKYHRLETGYGQFSRSLPFPDVVDSDKIEASFENGELKITIPKKKEKAGKKIKVS